MGFNITPDRLNLSDLHVVDEEEPFHECLLRLGIGAGKRASQGSIAGYPTRVGVPHTSHRATP